MKINTNALGRFFTLLIVCVFTMTLTGSCSGGNRKVNLRGSWKFSLGDNMSFAKPNYNDSDWERIYVPSAWQTEGFRRYNGYAWYRTTFEIDFTDNEPLYLELGRIDDVDEVYVNGRLVGGTGGFPPDYFTAYSVKRTYPIPTSYLIKGKKNVIAVRVYDEGGEGGILGHYNVGIYSYEDYYEVGYPLLGNWKFHLMDDLNWAKEDYDDAGWEDIVAPSYWEDQGFRDYDGFAWYRKKFTLPKDFKPNDMVVLLGRIDDMDEVFVNGQRIGSTGNIERKWARNEEYRKPRTYFIPDEILRPGKENLIAIRVFDQEQKGGMYEGPLAIIPRTQYKEFWREYQNENHSFYSLWSFLWD
jgi:sialate O-acetylesterase